MGHSGQRASVRGPPFSSEWGAMNFQKYLDNIFVSLWPPIWWSKMLWSPPPPSRATMLKKHVTPNARSTENMHFGDYSLNNTFIKICSHPIISWFFCDPHISYKKFCHPQLFHDPHIWKKMIAPRVGWICLDYTDA